MPEHLAPRLINFASILEDATKPLPPPRLPPSRPR